MTDKELYTLIGVIREARHAIMQADDALYGIFGYGEHQKMQRDLNINKALRATKRAIESLDTVRGSL